MRALTNRISKLRGFLYFSIVITLLTATLPVYADGMFIDYIPTTDKWSLISETDQQAYINYENGIQKMLLGINLTRATSGNNAWIFPVPAKPEDVNIDILDELPSLDGEDLFIKAGEKLTDTKHLMLSTQIYPIPFILLKRALSNSMSPGFNIGGSLNQSIYYSDETVTVYQHLQKNGFTTEVITAKDAQSIENYLKKVGLNFKVTSIDAFKEYISKDYTFVVTSNTKFNPIPDANRLTPQIKEQLLKQFDILPGNYFDHLSDYPDLAKVIDIVSGKYPEIAGKDFNTIRNFYFSRYSSETNRQAYQELYKEVEKTPLMVKLKDQSIEDLQYGFDKGIVGYTSGGKNPTTNTENTVRAIFVSFPTKKLYFPLILTNAYKEASIPITIRVLGFVNPKIYTSIKNFTNVHYFTEGQISGFGSDFYSGNSNNINYTRISINSPASNFTEDLWITTKPPLKIRLASFIVDQPTLYTILSMLFVSILTSYLVGRIVFDNSKSNQKKFLIIGALNFLSIIAVSIATKLTSFEKISPENVDQTDEIYTAKRSKRVKLMKWLPLLSIISIIGLYAIGVTTVRTGNGFTAFQLILYKVIPVIFYSTLIVEFILVLKNVSKKRSKPVYVFLFSVLFMVMTLFFILLTELYLGKSSANTIGTSPTTRQISI